MILPNAFGTSLNPDIHKEVIKTLNKEKKELNKRITKLQKNIKRLKHNRQLLEQKIKEREKYYVKQKEAKG